MELITQLLAAIVAASAPTPRTCNPSVARMQSLIIKYGQGRMRRRRIVAKLLAPRIIIEAKRWKMHPATLAAIGSIESDFRAYLRGRLRPGSRRSAEVGVWQLIPNDTPVKRARRLLDRTCRVAATCVAPDVWRRKRRRGRLRVRQLGDMIIGTWVVASELNQHVKACVQRRPGGHVTAWVRKWAKRHQVSLKLARRLSRLPHYNVGPRWSSPARLRKFTWYKRRFMRRWARFRRYLGCAKTTTVARVNLQFRPR